MAKKQEYLGSRKRKPPVKGYQLYYVKNGVTHAGEWTSEETRALKLMTNYRQEPDVTDAWYVEEGQEKEKENRKNNS